MKKNEYFKMYYSITDLKELATSEKMLLSLIIELDENKEGCIGTNKFFAESLCVTKDRIAHIIMNLVKLGYIERTFIADEQLVTSRKLIPSQKTLDLITE